MNHEIHPFQIEMIIFAPTMNRTSLNLSKLIYREYDCGEKINKQFCFMALGLNLSRILYLQPIQNPNMISICTDRQGFFVWTIRSNKHVNSQLFLYSPVFPAWPLTQGTNPKSRNKKHGHLDAKGRKHFYTYEIEITHPQKAHQLIICLDAGPPQSHILHVQNIYNTKYIYN